MDEHESQLPRLIEEAFSGEQIVPLRPPTKLQVEYERRRALLKGLEELVEHEPWIGSASDLVEWFEQRFATDGKRRPPSWPKSPSGLGLLLRKHYIDATRNRLDLDLFHGEDESRRTRYRIARLDP